MRPYISPNLLNLLCKSAGWLLTPALSPRSQGGLMPAPTKNTP